MSRIVWTTPALRDLNYILEYIAGYNRHSALRTIRLIRATISSFKRFPYGGRSGEVEGTREIIVPGMPYIVVYRISDEKIEVLRVRHGAQRWPPADEGTETF